MNKPKYNRCDCCGRNNHKIAIRYASGSVSGYCPSCFNDEFTKVLPPTDSKAPRNYYEVPYTAFLDGEGAKVLYDLRTRKGKIEYPLGVSRGDLGTELNVGTKPVAPKPDMHRVFVTMADGITYVVGGGTHTQALAEWQRLDDLRIAGYLPQVKFLEVRSADDTQARFANAKALPMNRLKATLTGRGFSKDEAAAREAWKLAYGREFGGGRKQGTGGWFYYSDGRPVAQGLWALAKVAKQQGMIVQGCDGRWYITDTEIVEPHPSVEDIRRSRRVA